ncbi:ExbD/TolR family protein [Propionispira raffinosivorans]|uniref:ExbD/TolR family protein n=1 Tax=Propionispira raffinosivorans TaxID=86959 RepID=UPI0003625C39|nr:biopolymer transporter ExbD [Propionispira raffinosivorans]
MKRRDFRIKKDPQLMIIPMIDIMFFLLVFFMMSTLYMVQLNTISVNLPQAAAAAKENKPDLVAITAMEDGTILYDKELVSMADLKEHIQSSLAKNGDTVFVLRGDKKVEYENIVTALDSLKLAGARRISIATELKVR